MAGIRVAVFSDVHGNVHGLRAVLADIEEHGPFDHIVVAGDHCLNGPDPAEALDLILSSSSAVLYGNTDRDITSSGETDPDLGRKKSDSISWTRQQLGRKRLKALEKLSFDFRIEAPDGTSLVVVHANPHDVDRHIFPDRSDEELRELIGEPDATILAFGHLHTPFVRQLDSVLLVNIASAGLPRDGDRRATWGEFNWSADTGWTADVHRVDYDFLEVVDRIYEVGMPNPDARANDIIKAVYE